MFHRWTKPVPSVDKNRSTGGTLLPTRRAQWQRTSRRRVGAGSKLTEVTAAAIELLIEGEWLKPVEATDKRAITQVLSRQQRLEGHDREAT